MNESPASNAIGAIAEIGPGIEVSNTVAEADRSFAELRGVKLPDKIAATGVAQRDDKVVVFGRGSVPIVGYVRASGMDEAITWGDRRISLNGVIIIDARPTLLMEPADAGACVLNEVGEVVGMVIHGEIRSVFLADHFIHALEGRKLPELNPALTRLVMNRNDFMDSWNVDVPIHRIYAVPIRPLLNAFDVEILRD